MHIYSEINVMIINEIFRKRHQDFIMIYLMTVNKYIQN